MKEQDHIEYEKSNKENSAPKIEKDDSGLSKSIQFVVNEVSNLLNNNSASKTKEQDISYISGDGGGLTVSSTEIHKTIQVSSAIKIRSNNSLLLSLTALLSNPHHTKYLNVMTENVIDGFLENSKINPESGNKTTDMISRDSKNSIVNLIASNLQYYLFEGRATNIIVNDLVVTLMKAFSNEKTPNKRFGSSHWETNSQVFIEARDWSVLIGTKECIFPKTCFELRDLLNKQGIKLKSYFENINDTENTMTKINVGLGVDSQDTNLSSIDDLDTQYFERLSYSKLKEYKSNNIPNYSQFEQLKKQLSSQHPNLKTLFYSPGSCIYINGNDVITFLDILKKSAEERIKLDSESRNCLNPKQTQNPKDPYWFLKDTKRIVSNFPVKDTIFKASTCDCNFIHNSVHNKSQGFYELNIEGMFLPNSLYVILNGFKILCPEISSCTLSVESYAEPPFLPSETNKPLLIWERLIPLLNSTIRSISPSLAEFASQLKPYTKVSFKHSKENSENKNNQDHVSIQTNNYPAPLFPLPRKRLNPSSQIQSSQRYYTNTNNRSNPQNFVPIGNPAMNHSASQIQTRNAPTSSSTFSNILFDFSTSNGVLENINAQVGSIFTSGAGNLPNQNGSSSTIENQALLALSHNNVHYHPPLLPSIGIRARAPNSLSANVQWLNFRGLGFSSQTNSNYVSLSTPMGKQLLHRIGAMNPIQRLEQAQHLINVQLKSNTKTLNLNQNMSITDNTAKIFEETALCFVGFDPDRLDYFTARAIEEGAKVIKLDQLEREYIKQYSKSPVIKEMNISNFACSWINVSRFYCVLDDSKFQSEGTKQPNDRFEGIFEYVDVQQLVTLEWFLTSCFERRSIDPDMFAPICRPAIPVLNTTETYQTSIHGDDLLVIIIENFPHMNKVYNSSKDGQESLSNAIWGNCMQRILKSIYGPNITSIKDFSNFIEKNRSKWRKALPNIVLVPCNLIPYHSNSNISIPDTLKTPTSVLYGQSKCQFIKDLCFIEKILLNQFNTMEGESFNEIVSIVTPSWLLESCSKRIKINYRQFEVKQSISIVQFQKGRNKGKTNISDDQDCYYKEEVCFFYKKEQKSNMPINIVPPYGPWPLWGWSIYIIDSIGKPLSKKLRIKLKDLGAIYFDSMKLFEEIDAYSIDQMKELLEEMEQTGINIIICNDFLDAQLSKKMEGINNLRKNGTSYGVSKKLNVVSESWINMVHGTRTLHPFESKFYFDRPSLDLNKDTDCKGVRTMRAPEDPPVLKKTGQNEDYNYNIEKVDRCINCDDRCVPYEDCNVSVPDNPIKTKDAPICNIDVHVCQTSKVNVGDMESTGTVTGLNAVQNSISENGLNKPKRRRTTKKNHSVMENRIQVESVEKTIENNGNCFNSGITIEEQSAMGQCNKTENEFLVPLSLSFMSNWADGKNMDYLPIFCSSHTPIRKGYAPKETHTSTPTKAQIDWDGQFEHIDELINDSIYPNGSNDYMSQTDKTTAFQKTSDESEDDLSNVKTDHYSPILCPIMPIYLNY
ncbi:hypothetical protein OJ252_1764 [Cryptosporidium canis]|uniref:BRCT domain-containing protein n=1 Tax=Cryptosporidium canis TaxID=195482 RepID=A0ABQ8P735_9CRYT|nr:hypothetical protein OJ252_1764 [Cryptosporidium canis]